MDVRNKRNFIIVGHANTGKTSLVESLLFVSKEISRKGDVMQGTTVSDFNDDEKERNISINASFLKINFKNYRMQFIDTPGYQDFVGEMICSLHAVDAAVVVVDAIHGVDVGTEDVWQSLEDTNTPRILFINKIDKEGANVDEAIASIKEQLSPKAFVINMLSSDLVESVAELDDKLLEKYLETGSLDSKEVEGALRKAVLFGKIFPIIVGSAISDKGSSNLLDAIIDYFPSPLERGPISVVDLSTQENKKISPSEDGPFLGFSFKSFFDPHLGQLSLVRVFKGVLKANTDFYNVSKSIKDHSGTINILQGKEQINIQEASCGDIIALPKLKNTHVADTLCDIAMKEKLLIDQMVFPEPAISASVKPKTREDEEKIATSLHKMCEEDQTFKAFRNNETKELIISGMGDLHLKVMLDRMQRRYSVDVELGTPKVSYRETITRKAKARYKHKKQSGGRGQYADVDIEISPLGKEEKQYEFNSKIFGGSIPRNFIPSVENRILI